MRDRLFRKSLVIGIITLFVVVGIYSAVASESRSYLDKKQGEPDIIINIFTGNITASGIEKLFGCTALVRNHGNDPININITFKVASYNIKGDYLGVTTIFVDDTRPIKPNFAKLIHITPNYYGELITWVKATVEINNGEQKESEIGISIGKWIHFFYFLT